MHKLTEGAVLVISLLLAAKWVLDPSGPYEPLLAFLGIAWVLFDFFSASENKK